MSAKTPWDDKDIDLYKSLYGKINCKEMQAIYFPHKTLRQVQALKVRLKLSPHRKRLINKFDYNKSYFDILNTNNCYIAGLWAADGCILQNSDRSFSIDHTSIDQELLEEIKNEVEFDGPIKKYCKITADQKYFIWKMHIGGIQDDWFPILSDKFYLVPRKTYCLKPPKLQEISLQLAWIKGFIDGDGCISLDNNNRLRISIVCHEKIVLDWILSIYQKYIPTQANIYCAKNKQLFTLELSGNMAYDMGKILSQSTQLGLKRKWTKLEDWRKKNNVCL